MLPIRRLLLGLGLVAGVPAAAQAGPFDFFKKSSPTTIRAASQSAKAANQRLAGAVAGALRGQRLVHSGVKIQCQDGVVSIRGQIASQQQKAVVSQLANRVPGVKSVRNQLVVNSRLVARPAGRGPIRLASGAKEALFGKESDNQAVAQHIAGKLGAAKLKGYNIRVVYQDGTALLSGAVADPSQAQKALQVVQGVPQVKKVVNQLQIATAQPSPGQPRPAGPLAPGPMPPGMPPHVHGGAGNAMPTYNNAKLPDYAWPTYAPYPNSARVMYPKQYSASAWPYIGPYYPYPQVPLDWRQATLEWDDGHWSLRFDTKTDKWFWFLNPKHW